MGGKMIAGRAGIKGSFARRERPAPPSLRGVVPAFMSNRRGNDRPGGENRRRRRENGIIGWIILGLLAGALAKLLLPGDDPGGFIVTTLLGVAGAFIGGLIVKALGFGDPIDEFFDLSTWLGAIIGSVILLLGYRLLVGRRDRSLRERLT